MSSFTTRQMFLSNLGRQYVRRHTRKEDLFWQLYMGHQPRSKKLPAKYASAEANLNKFRQDPSILQRLERLDMEAAGSDFTLNGWLAMFKANTIADPEARKLGEEIVEMETALVAKRQKQAFGLVDPQTGLLEPMGVKQLLLVISSDPNGARRKAAYDGVLKIEEFVLQNGFLDIVRARNRFARMLGYVDFYDYRVQTIEGMSKKHLFQLLDKLADALVPRAQQEVKRVARSHGDGAYLPWNFGFFAKGKTSIELDPYFPFGQALERWGRTFHGLGIKYQGARLAIDLVERKGKYPNGFMHAPGLVYQLPDGSWTQGRINFTANAIPGQIGSGFDAMLTLLHEGGHAAHFSNIRAGAPCFAHEYAPTSTGHAETQSMSIDALIRDPLWRHLYARDRNDGVMPEDLNLTAFREDRQFRPWTILSLLTIAIGEKQLYETPDDELTPERAIADARQVEQRLQGLSYGGIRPLFAVPHLLAGESSANYHGYVIASMGVAQTWAHFNRMYPSMVNCAQVGPSLAQSYWQPGNSVSFSGAVMRLTGSLLSPDALIRESLADVDEACFQARDQVRVLAPSIRHVDIGEVNLGANVKIVHGKELIAHSENPDGQDFPAMCEQFSAWIKTLEDK